MRLGQIISVKHGYAFQGEHFGDDGDYIVLTPGNFHEEGGFKSKTGKEKRYTTTPPREYVLREGDLVIAMTEQAEGLLGSSALIPAGDTFLHNQRIGLIRLDRPDIADKNFLYYLFNTKAVRAQIQATATGAKVRHTAPDRIASVTVSIPPIETQRTIVDLLAAYEELIKVNDRRIEILDEMTWLIYQQWYVRRGLRGEDDDASATSGVRTIPSDWTSHRLGDLVEFRKGIKPKSVQVEQADGLVPHLLLDVIEGKTTEFTSSSGALLAAPDDVLMVMDGARSGVVFNGLSGAVGSTLARLRPYEKQRFSPLLLALFLQDHQEDIRSKNVGAAIPHANKDYFRVMEVRVPPQTISVALHNFCEPLFRLKWNLSARNAGLRKIQRLLLPKLMAGALSLPEVEMGRDETA